MPDRYDQDIEYLTKNPDKIFEAWCSPFFYVPGGSLFRFAGMRGAAAGRTEHGVEKSIGCLTMIRSRPGCYAADNQELSKAIAADNRLPKDINDVRPRDLLIFAAWQRRLDAEIGRPPFPMLDDIPLPAAEFPTDDAFVNDPNAPKERSFRQQVAAAASGVAILVTSLLVCL